MKTSSSGSKLPVPRSGRSRVRAVPDFEKLHNQWKNKLEQGKACTKKPCTVAQGFDLTSSGTKFERPATRSLSAQKLSRPMRQTKQSDFRSNASALRSILNENGISKEGLVGRATIASFSSMRPSTSGTKLVKIQEDNRSPDFGAMAQTQEESGLQFEADDGALESILMNRGIVNDFAKPKGPVDQRQTVGGFKTPLRPAANPRPAASFSSVRRSIYYTRESVHMGRSPLRPSLCNASARLSCSARRPPQRVPMEPQMGTPPVRIPTPNSNKKSAIKWKDLLGPHESSEETGKSQAPSDPVVTTLLFDDEASNATPPGQNLQRLKELEEAERLLEEEIRLMESGAEGISANVTEVKVIGNFEDSSKFPTPSTRNVVQNVTPHALSTPNVRCSQVQGTPVMSSDRPTARFTDVEQRSTSTSKKMTRKQAVQPEKRRLSRSVEKASTLSDKRIPLAARSPNVISTLPQDQYLKRVASPKNKSRQSSPSMAIFKDKSLPLKLQSPLNQQQVYFLECSEKENSSPHQIGVTQKDGNSPYFSPALRDMKASKSPRRKQSADVSIDDLNQSLNMSVLQYAELQEAADTLELESEVADEFDDDVHAQLELIKQKQAELLQLQLTLQKRIVRKTKSQQKPKTKPTKESKKSAAEMSDTAKKTNSDSDQALHFTPLTKDMTSDQQNKTHDNFMSLNDINKEAPQGHWKKRLMKSKGGDENLTPDSESRVLNIHTKSVSTPVSRMFAGADIYSTSVTTQLSHTLNPQVVMSPREAPISSSRNDAKNATPTSRRLFSTATESIPELALPRPLRAERLAAEEDDIPPAPIKTPLVMRSLAKNASSPDDSGLEPAELAVVNQKHKDSASGNLIDAVSTLVNMHELILTPERNRRKNSGSKFGDVPEIKSFCLDNSDKPVCDVEVLLKDGSFSPIRIRSPARITSPARKGTSPATISVVSPSAVSLVTINPETRTVTQTTWKSPVRKISGEIGSLSLTGNLSDVGAVSTGLPSMKFGPLFVDTSFDMRAKPVDPEITKKIPGLLMTAKTMAEVITPVRQKGPALRMLAAAHRYHEALLDDEASLYACRLRPSPTRSRVVDLRCPDPVTKALSSGDDMHFIPILHDSPTRTPEKSEHDRGSAFSIYRY